MREFTVMFRSVKEIRDFVIIANKQPYDITLRSENSVFNAKSILGLCSIRLGTPVSVQVMDRQSRIDAFAQAIAPFVVDAPVPV